MPIQPTRTLWVIAVIGLWLRRPSIGCGVWKQIPVVGYDILQQRIDELQSGHDRTHETSRRAAGVSCVFAIQQQPKGSAGLHLYSSSRYLPPWIQPTVRTYRCLSWPARRLDKPFGKMPW